ncbi:hypothetical protein CFN78_15485 [Amycolatopsis antarctica]|uniref:HTH cro/C1-type domain-containing protein n=1 Tax=Amycolatopsis antarctica TaxID=1854586 RepID=A0A263D4J0_9PSEU|nr:helix-turn-helix transcriptional regulator [Amycolatopsis antarctica]OZM72386.1 hypothetical protein CFN78_15485 [Amycolatopsis antarctica]
MAQARQTFERRQLGLTMRRLRDAAGKTQSVAAEAIGKARSRVVQLEDGTATASEADLTTLLDLYGVADETERATVVDLGAQARRRERRGPHYDVLPDSYLRLADLESSATEINCLEQGIIPGLLQSPYYLRAVFGEAEGVLWKRGGKEITERIEFREHRQARIWEASKQPIMRYVITEDALRANMGSPEVMHQQLTHLLKLMEEHPSLTIRVLETTMYGNPLRGTSLTVFAFATRGAPIGYATAAFSPSAYFDDEDEVAGMLRVFHHIWERSLSRIDSQMMIEGIAKEL